MWTYKQATGKLEHEDKLIGTGYSGRGKGRNNPAMQNVKRTGPLPRNLYDIGEPVDHPRLGKNAIPLKPRDEENMFGRDDFWIHGNNKINDASKGCIIMGPVIRQQVINSPDKSLVVI